MKTANKAVITLVIMSVAMFSSFFFFSLMPIAELNKGLDSRWSLSIHELFNTRDIQTIRVYLGYYKGSEESARRLAKKLKYFGANVRSHLAKDPSTLNEWCRDKNSFSKPLATDAGMEQVLAVASSTIEFELIRNSEPWKDREPISILLYK